MPGLRSCEYVKFLLDCKELRKIADSVFFILILGFRWGLAIAAFLLPLF